MKTKRCKTCKEQYTPRSPMQTACNPVCALSQAKAKRETAQQKKAKEEKRQDREKLQKLKTRSDWIKETQIAFNRYCRLRDANDGCISCDKPASWDGQWHASHFRSVGASPATRFNLWNVHKACSVCNNYLSGNLSEYEPRLRKKIGDEKVDKLRSLNHTVKYSVEYLIRMRNVFARKAKRIKRSMERHTGI